VAERFVVPLKPGNAGGGKGLSSRQTQDVVKNLGDWATYKLHDGFRNCRRRRTPNMESAALPRRTPGAVIPISSIPNRQHRHHRFRMSNFVQTLPSERAMLAAVLLGGFCAFLLS
jgi:hypothetical protein